MIAGATAVGLSCTDGVVLAAEKRMALGRFIQSRNVRKVFLVDERIGAAVAGLFSDSQQIVRLIKAYVNLYNLEREGEMIGTRTAAKLMANVLFNNRIFPYYVEPIVGGTDKKGNHIYVLDPIGSLMAEDYAATGTGAQIAIGVLEDGYFTDITTNKGRELVIETIRMASRREATSGDGIDVLVITPEKGGIIETIPPEH
ncbi:MAG: proteasome subunit beta [Candidatus Heimdallarchaeota archaeon]